jgi:hypothetical protein
MGLGERSNGEASVRNKNQRSVSRKQAGRDQRKVKTRALESHKGAPPKIVSRVILSAARPDMRIFKATCDPEWR